MANEDQRAFWNEAAARWVTHQDHIDQLLAPLTERLFAFAAPRAGERVLDVGCGTGTVTLQLASRVGPEGAVLGIDIAAPMIAAARERAAGTAVRFVEADAATHPFASEHDLVFSRFGVMFFPDPVAAFANLRRAFAPGGRLAMMCWRGLEANPWATVPMVAARPLLPPQEPFDPLAPGPFAFGDGERVRTILVAAGYRDVEVVAADDRMVLGASAAAAADTALAVGPLARIAEQLEPPARAAIHARVADALGAHLAGAQIALPAAVWLVRADQNE
jgi:SAM-dependent methyltransferase